MSEMWTCGRCGIKDKNVLNLDTGGTYHPELLDCIAALRAKQEPSEPVFHSANAVFRHYGLPICDCKVQHQPDCATRKTLNVPLNPSGVSE